MDELDETVLNLQQRQKRAQIMRRNAPKIERARKMAQKRLAPEKNIKQRAYAMARQLVRKRVAGARGAEYEKLGPTEKMIIDRVVEKKQKAIKKLALRLIPKVKSSEQKRLHTFMQGQRMQNHGAPEGHKAAPGAAVSEALNDKFQRTFQSVDGETNVANKTSNPNIVQYNTFGNEKLSDTNLYKSIAKKAKKTGIKEEILGEVYDRGLAAWYEETGVSQQQYAFARVNSYINQGKTYFNEDADLRENAWNQLGQKKPVGNNLPAPARGSVPKHGRRFSEGDHVVPHTGPYAGQVHRVTSSRAGSVNIVHPNSPKYDSITVRAKHEHLSPATPEQAAKYKADREADHKRMFGEDVELDEVSLNTLDRYISKASNDRTKQFGNERKYNNRLKGISQALKKGNEIAAKEGPKKLKPIKTGYERQMDDAHRNIYKEERDVELHDGGPSGNIKKAKLIGPHSTADHVVIRTHDYIGKPKDLVIHKSWIKENTELDEAGSKYNIPMARAPKANKAPVKTFMSVLDQVDIPAKHLDRARSVWNRTKDVDSVKKFVSSVKEDVELDEARQPVDIDAKEYAVLKKKHETARYNGQYSNALHVHKKDGEIWSQTYSHHSHGIPTIQKSGSKYQKFVKEETELDESNNTPYVKPHMEKGSTKQTAWKASNKHGHVKYFGMDFKKSAEKHAGISEETGSYVVSGKSPFYKKEHYLNTNDPRAHVIKSSVKHATRMTYDQAIKHAKDWERNNNPNKYKTNVVRVNEEIEFDESYSHLSTAELRKHAEDAIRKNNHQKVRDITQEIKSRIEKKTGSPYVAPAKVSQKTASDFERLTGKKVPSHRVEEVQQTNENFIDGKGPGKPGDSARHGLKGKSATELRKIRSSETASPRKKQLAHWMLNMHHNEEVEIDEVYQNDIVKSNKLSSRTLGKKLASGHKKIGTLPTGHEVHMKSDDRKHYYRVVDPHTKEVNTVLTTKPHKGGAEEIDTLVANDKSSGAHHLYQHLVLKHDKVLSSNNQSAGARKVWAKAASHRSIHTHGYDPEHKSAFHAHPSEDEHYSTDDDYDKVEKDMDTSKRDKRKYKKELDDIQSNDRKYIVMHKKLKEETELSELSTKIITAYRRGMEKDVALKPKMDPMKKAQRERGFRTSTHKILGLAKVNATESLKDPEDNPCWKGFKPVGTKKKAGKTVPNCVPESVVSEEDTGNGTNLVNKLSKNSKIRSKIEVVDRKPPHTEFTRQSEIQKKIIDEEGNCQNDPKKRLTGTDSLVKAYKKDTPGQGINEAFNIAYAAGVGVTLTAGDLGMKMQGGFAYHPSVVTEDEEVEEQVVTADKAPVVVPAHKDAYGNAIPAKTVMRKKNKVIVKSGNTHDGDN